MVKLVAAGSPGHVNRIEGPPSPLSDTSALNCTAKFFGGISCALTEPNRKIKRSSLIKANLADIRAQSVRILPAYTPRELQGLSSLPELPSAGSRILRQGKEK